VLIALGARTKVHGPHLPLNNDYIMAEYLKERILEHVSVIAYPTLQYGFYPAFLEYPGSVSLNFDTFKNIVLDTCRSISNYGIKKFYILNTGVSTLRPIRKAAQELYDENNIIVKFLNILEVDEKVPKTLLHQEGGTHADESETSMMLYMAPHIVNMDQAIKDYDDRPNRRGLTRNPDGEGVYSPSGIWGDPTLATTEKGRIITELLIEEIVAQIKALKKIQI
jgi:creatinine amidohydrolase